MTDKTLAQQVNIRASASNVPLSVLVELTHRCNLSCYFCYQKHTRCAGRLDTETWADILGQLADAGTLYLTISGGEPFLRKDIFQILERARKRGFAVSLISNGTLIYGTTARKLRELGVMDVGVSFHAADPALHDRLTGVPGSFERALRGLRNLLGADMRVLLKHSVSSGNFGEYRRLEQLANEEGALFECDSVVVPVRPGSVSPFALSMEQHRTFLHDMGATPSVCAHDSAFKENLHCDAGRSLCGIGPEGNVFPCIQLPVILGNLGAQPFRSIWSGRSARRVRRQEKHLDSTCCTCELCAVCARCHGVAYLETGNWRGPSPSLCRRARAMVSGDTKNVEIAAQRK